MKLLPFERKWRFQRPLEILAVAAVALPVLVSPAGAQHSDAHSDGNAARYDMMFGTPGGWDSGAGRGVATTPGRQQARRSRFTVNVLAPIFTIPTPTSRR